ncbi:MAG: plasmid pRiA4b ORF-3 family protein [Blastocatellia bacterium]
MTNPAKQPSQSYTALVHQVVREAEEPIPVAEIMRRVHSLRPIESPSPERLIRHAVSQARLIANTGDGRYWWYPRLLKGSRARVPLIASDLELGRIVFDHDARDLLWPSFFAGSEQVDRNPIELRLGACACVSLPFEHFGEGVWGTTGSPKFWNWLRACEAAGSDALIFEAIDAEARRYRVDLDAASVRDESAIRRRTAEVEQAARDHMWKRRVFTVAVWDLAQHLLATGCYRHPIPPDPISPFWRRIESQIEMLRVYADEFAGRRRRSIKKGRKKVKTKAAAIYQLKVTLRDIYPPIWRRLQVAGDTTLGDLHWILQLGMGWTHSHLHRFEIGDAQYSDPTFDLNEAPDEFGNEFRARLDRVVSGEGARFLYEYDFGDCWRHEIGVEKILPAAEGETYPKLVDGERACPPEDCGGFIGYANFLEGIGDENHPEHEDLLAWAGGNFDPERFDVEGVNWVLRKFAEIE